MCGQKLTPFLSLQSDSFVNVKGKSLGTGCLLGKGVCVCVCVCVRVRACACMYVCFKWGGTPLLPQLSHSLPLPLVSIILLESPPVFLFAGTRHLAGLTAEPNRVTLVVHLLGGQGQRLPRAAPREQNALCS